MERHIPLRLITTFGLLAASLSACNNYDDGSVLYTTTEGLTACFNRPDGLERFPRTQTGSILPGAEVVAQREPDSVFGAGFYFDEARVKVNGKDFVESPNGDVFLHYDNDGNLIVDSEYAHICYVLKMFLTSNDPNE